MGDVDAASAAEQPKRRIRLVVVATLALVVLVALGPDIAGRGGAGGAKSDDAVVLNGAPDATTISFDGSAQPDADALEKAEALAAAKRQLTDAPLLLKPAPEDTNDCVPATLRTQPGNGIAACAVAVPNPELIPAAAEDVAQATLFGHCAPPWAKLSEARQVCGTYYREFEYLKVHRVSEPTTNRRRKKLTRVPPTVYATEEMAADGPAPLGYKWTHFTPWLGFANASDPERRAWVALPSNAKTTRNATALRLAATDASDAFASTYAWWHASAPPAVEGETAAGRIPLPGFMRGVAPPVVKYDVAVMLPSLTTCMSNLYHGLFDYLLPTMQALMAVRRLHPGAQRIALLVRTQHVQNWGNHNSRCPVLNNPPYGFGAPARTSFVLHAMRQAFKRLDVVGYNEQWRVSAVGDNGQQEVNATVKADTLYRGLPASCFTVTANMEQSLTHHVLEYPLVKRSRRCSKVVDAMRTTVLSAFDIAEAPPVSTAEARCPHVLVVSRERRANGRAQHDPVSFEAAIRDGVREHSGKTGPASCWTVAVVELETVAIDEQIRLMQNATVVVAARGAGQVMALFMREGAALVGLSPRRDQFPMMIEDGTVPWAPWGFALEGRHTVLGTCPYTLPNTANTVHRSNCLASSTNFCNLKCDPGNVTRLVRVGLAHVVAAAEERSATASREGGAEMKAHTTFLVPLSHQRGLTRELKTHLVRVAKTFVAATKEKGAKPKSFAHMVASKGGPPRRVNNPKKERPVPDLLRYTRGIRGRHVLYLDTDLTSMLDATLDRVVSYTPANAGTGGGELRPSATGSFARARVSHEERLLAYAAISNSRFSETVLGPRTYYIAIGQGWAGDSDAAPSKDNSSATGDAAATTQLEEV